MAAKTTAPVQPPASALKTPATFAAWLNKTWPNARIPAMHLQDGTVIPTGSIGSQWNAYYSYAHKAHPKATLRSIETSYYFWLVQESVAGAIGGAVTAGGQTIGKVAQGTAAGVASLYGGNCCLVKIPYLNACILGRTQARALVGGMVGAAAFVLGIIAASLLVVEGFQRSGAGAAAGRTLETVGAGMAFVPGMEGAGLAVGAVGGAAQRAGSRSGASGSLARRRSERATAARQQAGQAQQQQGETP